jgi:hypothetical protein
MPPAGSNPGHLYMSTDEGEHWPALTTDFAPTPVPLPAHTGRGVHRVLQQKCGRGFVPLQGRQIAALGGTWSHRIPADTCNRGFKGATPLGWAGLPNETLPQA